jgi:hypothetical protein
MVLDLAAGGFAPTQLSNRSQFLLRADGRMYGPLESQPSPVTSFHFPSLGLAVAKLFNRVRHSTVNDRPSSRRDGSWTWTRPTQAQADRVIDFRGGMAELHVYIGRHRCVREGGE